MSEDFFIQVYKVNDSRISNKEINMGSPEKDIVYSKALRGCFGQLKQSKRKYSTWRKCFINEICIRKIIYWALLGVFSESKTRKSKQKLVFSWQGKPNPKTLWLYQRKILQGNDNHRSNFQSETFLHYGQCYFTNNV